MGREMRRKIQNKKEIHRKSLGQMQFWGSEGPSCVLRCRRTDLETQIQRLGGRDHEGTGGQGL